MREMEGVQPGIKQLSETEQRVRLEYTIPREEGIRTMDALRQDARVNGGRFIEPILMKPFIPVELHGVLSEVQTVRIDGSGNVGYEPKPK